MKNVFSYKGLKFLETCLSINLTINKYLSPLALNSSSLEEENEWEEDSLEGEGGKSVHSQPLL